MRRDELSASCHNPYERNLTLDANEVTRKNASFLMAVAPLPITAAMPMVQFFVVENFTSPVPLAFGIVVCGFFALASVRDAPFAFACRLSPLDSAATANAYRSVTA